MISSRIIALLSLLLLSTCSFGEEKKAVDQRAQVMARRYLRRVKSVGSKEVKLRLIADVESLAADKPFRLGLHFTISKGWHIYSHKPGDGYLPTKFDLQLPKGFEVVKTVWPKPEKVGDFPGYHKSVMATVWVKPSAAASADVKISAKASWQFCDDKEGVCRLGKGTPTLSLKSGAAKPSRFAPLFPKP